MAVSGYNVAAQQVVGSAPIFYGLIAAGSPVSLQARVLNDIGTAINAAQVSSVNATVTDLSAGTVGAPISLNVAECFGGNNQPWPVDSSGYNVAIRLDGSNFIKTATTYQVVISITPSAGGSAFNVIWQLQTDAQL